MFQYHKAIFNYSFKINLAKFQQEHNKNILETALLNLSNPEKSVVSEGKAVPHTNNLNAEKNCVY